MNYCKCKNLIAFSIFNFLLLTQPGCNSSVNSSDSTNSSISGTERMAYILDSLVEFGKPLMYYHWNSVNAKYYAEKIQKGDSTLGTLFIYWNELLNSGDSEKTILEVENYLKANYGERFTEDITVRTLPIYELLALSYLRLGEQENCLNNHNANNCILPLRQDALYSIKNYSEEAIKIYSKILEKFPQNYTSLWLYNLANMTLANDLSSIPTKFQLNYPNWDREQKEFPSFENIAGLLGVDINGNLGGTCVDDFNNDGFMDIFVTSQGMEDQVQLFFSTGDGGFENVTQKAGLNGIVSGINAIHADYNNDGFKDILVLRGGWLNKYGTHPNSLLKNNGDGTFSDVTIEAGLLSFRPTQTAVWADFNNDGNLDLFIGNESASTHPYPSEMFYNNGDGTFRNVSDEVGFSNPLGYVKGVIAGDINNDGYPDLYISILEGLNKLYLNSNGKFIDIGRKAGVQEPFFSFPTWFFDFNNDGFDDIFVSGYHVGRLNDMAGDFAQEIMGKSSGGIYPKLYLNNKNNTFSDVAEIVGLDKVLYTMGSNYGDLDNDGYLDFYAGTGAPHLSTVVPNRMFHSVNGNYFEEVTSAGHFGHIQKGHAVAFADFDNDGDQDIYAVIGGALEGDVFRNVFYENPTNNINNWINIVLKGVKNNRDGIGAKIILTVMDDSGKKRNIVNTVSTGGSFGSSSIQQEIGLGKADVIDRLTVNWPDRQSQIFFNIEPNQSILIEENADSILPLKRTIIKLGSSGSAANHHN